MKIIEFRGGLGNQMFEYVHYLYLKKKYPRDTFYGYYPSRELWCHQGLEIHKRFTIDLPKSSILTNIIGWILFTFNRKKIFRYLVKLSRLVSTDAITRESALLQEGYWQDKKYLVDNYQFTYSTKDLNNRTKELWDEINRMQSKSCTPVSVHIRRGDYLFCDTPEDFAGICTPQYYANAIQRINNTIEKPFFIFFSDDPDFVRNEFHLSNMRIIDWNKGEDSWQDMFLMSQCKAMILANSTFSFWAAQNNQHQPLVLCPMKWNNISNPQITMPGWQEIASY